MRFGPAGAAAVAALALATTTASAATRYTAPTGSGTTCALGSECAVTQAFTGAGSGDTIIIEAGVYHLTNGTLRDTVGPLTVRGDAIGVGRPVLIGTGIELQKSGSSISDVDIRNTHGDGGIHAALVVGAGATADRVIARADTIRDGCTVSGTLTNSICTKAGVNSSGASGGNAAYRNDTIQGGSFGLFDSTPSPGDTTATNVVARGADQEDFYEVNNGTIQATNSDYATSAGVTDQGGHQTTDPVYAGPPTADPDGFDITDYREASGSVTIDNGTDTGVPVGDHDLNGNARHIGTHTDIGAYEFVPQAPSLHVVTASSTTPTTASIRVAFDTNGGATTLHVLYGTSALDHNSDTVQVLGLSPGQSQVTIPLAGLTTGASYQYQVIADSDGGESPSGVQSFTAGGRTWYATPSPDAAADCSQAAPCDLETAYNSVTEGGDTIVVGDGAYGSIDGGLSFQITDGFGPLTIRGESLGPDRPVLYTDSNVALTDPGSTMSDVDLRASDSSVPPGPLQLASGAGADRVIVRGVQLPCLLADASVMSNSLCLEGDQNAFWGIETNGTSTPGALHNDTVAGTGGIAVPNATNPLTIANTITHGTNALAADVQGDVFTTLINSEYETHGPIADGGGNVHAPPAFVSAPQIVGNLDYGDYHEAPGAPSIDAGSAAQAIGPYDLDGNLRTIGSAPDIGAYEHVAVAPAVTTPTGAASGGSGETIDTTFDTNGGATDYHLEFGIGDFSHSSATKHVNGSAPGSAAPAHFSLDGLPDGLYEYRVVAANAAGTTTATGSFRIGPEPPPTPTPTTATTPTPTPIPPPPPAPPARVVPTLRIGANGGKSTGQLLLSRTTITLFAGCANQGCTVSATATVRAGAHVFGHLGAPKKPLVLAANGFSALHVTSTKKLRDTVRTYLRKHRHSKITVTITATFKATDGTKVTRSLVIPARLLT